MISQNDQAGLAHAKKLIKENLESQATFLDLGNCGLRDLSELPELWECQHLEGLNMGPWYWDDGEYIKSKGYFGLNIIGDIGTKLIAQNLKKMTFLHLRSNKIEDSSAIFVAENLQQLTSLDLGYNNIGTEGAKVVAENLKQLTFLNMSWSKIQTAGAKAIAQNLGKLTHLNLDSNMIGDEGAKIIANYLSNLEILELGSNNIENDGAIEIGGNLKKIYSLNLQWNLIGNYGAKMIAENLQSLKSLNFWSNEIENEGTIRIAENLKYLLFLNLENNRISYKGAYAISKNLTLLTTLYLGFNKIGDRGVKAIVENLKSLTSLYLEQCQIGDKGSDVFLKNFSQFNNLILVNNKISNLSSFIPLLKNKSNIKFVFDDEDNYSGFNISNNPIVEPPLEIVDQGKEAIIRYFDNLEKEKAVNLAPFINKEVKLILAGNSNAGKSTLVKYLTDGVIDKNIPSTHWMEIKNWENPFPDKPQIENIRIFDFGGQEYYHDTHYLFFTNNTAYILLWDKEGNSIKEINVLQRSPIDGNIKDVKLQCFPIEYWLDAISHFCKPKFYFSLPFTKFSRLNSEKVSNNESSNFEIRTIVEKKPKVLILQNKLDEGSSIKLPMEGYERNYEGLDIFDNSAISIYEDRFLSNMTYTIKMMIESMDIVGKLFLGTYKIIRENLLKYSGEMVLTLNSFQNKCNQWIIEAGKISNKNYESLKFDQIDAEICARTFYSLGYLMYYPDSELLKNKIFINQKLITDSIHKILSNAEYTFGEIDKKDSKVKTNLNDENVNNVIVLMQEFKIVFKHPDPNKTDTYIAPLYLSEQPTKGISFFLSSLQKPIYRIQYDGFIHKSIILEFFQEYGQHVLKESNVSHEDVFYYWRKGIVVKKATDIGKEGLVLVQFFDGEDIKDENEKTIRVPAHIDIFSLKDGSDELITEIRSKLSEINKGWKVTEMVTVDGQQFVRLAEIHEHERNKQYVFQYANQQFQLIHFKQYLTNEYPMKKVFISYSKSDEHYRNELEKHLSVLKRNGHIATWHDRKLLPGEKWDGKIRQELKEADIILFLVSADFLATDYIWDVEIKEAIERDEKNEDVHVVPIIVRPCDWYDSPLGIFNSGTVKGRAISLADNTDAAFLDVVELLKGIIKK